jgi:hypothetical protein
MVAAARARQLNAMLILRLAATVHSFILFSDISSVEESELKKYE